MLGGLPIHAQADDPPTELDILDTPEEEALDAQTLFEEHGSSDDLPNLALGSFGVSGGWPGYQLYALNTSVQYDIFGLAARGSYTAAGPYVSLAGRVYLPIPIPVPTYASLGGGFFASDPVLFASLGGHVPLSDNLRLDIEAGATRTVVFDRAQLLPYASVGISYVFTFDPAEHSSSRNLTPRSSLSEPESTVCTEPREPDEESLRAAVGRRLRQFVAQARVTYAGVYRNLNYSYSITSLSIRGDRGSARIRYSGSVVEVATGRRHEGSGTASGEFRWDGCSWRNTSIDY